jgi:hypothetical protein
MISLSVITENDMTTSHSIKSVAKNDFNSGVSFIYAIQIIMLLIVSVAQAAGIHDVRAVVTQSTSAVINVPDDYTAIQEAIDAANDGDTILVAQGTYYENLNIQNKNNIILKGDGINRSIIDGSGIDRVIHAQRNYDLSIVIEGFTIRNGSESWGAGIFLNTGGPCCNSSVNAVISNCEITDNDGTGIVITNDWAGTSYIENNIISNNKGSGFDPSIGTYYLQHNTIVQNRFGYYDYSGYSANVIIRNNIIASNERYGIVKHRTTPVYISHNNVWNNSDGEYYEHGDGPATPFTPTPGTGEISKDPYFIDEKDYHLAVNSPCIDVGTDAGVYIDYDGDVRPLGSGFDMGADEFVLSDLSIDIMPGKETNIINMKSGGFVPIAVITLDDYDALQINPESVIFGPDEALTERYKVKDVDRDGDEDLLMYFRIQNTGILCSDTKATLSGQLYDGTPISGTDTLQIKNCQ